MWDLHTKAKSLSEMKKTLLISGHQCCICTSICLKPTTHAMRSTQIISIRKWRTSSSHLRELNPGQSSPLCLLFPTWDIHLKKPPNHPNQRHNTYIQSLSPAQSIFYAWEENLKGRTPQNIPILMEGNKFYWAHCLLKGASTAVDYNHCL